MTKIIKIQNWNLFVISITYEPAGALFELRPKSILSISNPVHDLGDRIVISPDGNSMMISVMSDEPDFYETIVVNVDGVDQSW